jgi:hypothetical protein
MAGTLQDDVSSIRRQPCGHGCTVMGAFAGPRLFGQAEHPLADDMAPAAVDGLGPGQQERPLQRLEGVVRTGVGGHQPPPVFLGRLAPEKAAHRGSQLQLLVAEEEVHPAPTGRDSQQ